MLSFMAAFWTLGNIFVAGLAWLIIPSHIDVSNASFTYNSWRIFLMVCSLPSFLVTFMLFYLPESPKFLLSRGKFEKALEVFKGIYADNTGNARDLYPVKELIIDDQLKQDLEDSKRPIKGRCKKMFWDVGKNSKQLFSKPVLKFTLISITINFTFHIGYYGLIMWLPELFNRFDEYASHFGNNDVTSVCTVTDFVVKNGSHSSIGNCTSDIPSSVFLDSLITLSSALPANLIAILGMDRLGRKFFLVFSTLSAGICSGTLYFVRNKTQNLIVSAVFTGVISCGNAALDCLITEIFPTNLRATGIAISMIFARLGGIIGNVVIAQLLDEFCPAPTLIIAFLIFAGGLISLFLPNTTRKPLS